MSTYDMLIQKGFELGVQQISREIDLKYIKNGLKEGLSTEILAKLIGFSEKKVKQIISEIQE